MFADCLFQCAGSVAVQHKGGTFAALQHFIHECIDSIEGLVNASATQIERVRIDAHSDHSYSRRQFVSRVRLSWFSGALHSTCRRTTGINS